MSQPSRLPAILVYLLPIVGWLYVFLFQRQNRLAIFHLKQAIGLVLFLITALAVWAVVAWLLALIPLMATISVGLFTLVMAVYFYGFVAWIFGMINAANNRLVTLPGFGDWANRLPLQ